MRFNKLETAVSVIFFCLACQTRQPAEADAADARPDGLEIPTPASLGIYSWGGDALFNLETPTSTIADYAARVRLSVTDQDDEVVHLPDTDCLLSMPKCVWLLTIAGPAPDAVATLIVLLIPAGADLGKAGVKFYFAGKRVPDIKIWKPPPNSTSVLLMAGKHRQKRKPF